MKFIALPVRNLRSHRIRSVLTTLGIAVALASLIALVGLSRGMEQNSATSLKEWGAHIIASQKGAVEMLTATVDEGLAPLIRTQPGVTEVTGTLGDLVELDTGEMIYLSGWPLESDFWRNLNVREGKAPSANEPENVVLGEALAEILGKKPGDDIQLSGRDFKIGGVSRHLSVMDDRSVMVPLPTLQRLIGREGKVTGFLIRVDHPEDAAEMARIRSRLALSFPALDFVEADELARNNHLARLVRAIAWSSSWIAMSMAFLAVLNTLLMSVTERMREIGLYNALGWGTSRVIAMVVLEGVLLSAAGAVLGVILGLVGIRWIMALPQIGAMLQPEVTPILVLEAIGLALLLGAFGGLYPAWRATRMNPVDLLRSE